MKNIKYILLLFVSIAFLSSCKKDDPQDEEEDTVVEQQEVIAFNVKIDDVDIESNTLETAVVKIFNTVGEEGQLGFNITNNKTEDIKLRMSVVDVVGNGQDMQLCFETCKLSIALDDTEIKTIAAGYTTSDLETHIYNGQNGSRGFECTLKINQVDDDNADIPNGKEVYFTYKYDAP